MATPNLVSLGAGDWIGWFGVVGGLLTMEGRDGACWQYQLPTDDSGNSLAVTLYRMMKGPQPALSGATSRHHNLKTRHLRHAGPEFWIDQLLRTMPYRKIASLDWPLIAAGGPGITSITPTTGPAGGGTALVITGWGFATIPHPTVTLQGSPMSGISFVSDTEINATTPGGSVGAARLTVTNPSGSASSDLFSYTP